MDYAPPDQLEVIDTDQHGIRRVRPRPGYGHGDEAGNWRFADADSERRYYRMQAVWFRARVAAHKVNAEFERRQLSTWRGPNWWRAFNELSREIRDTIYLGQCARRCDARADELKPRVAMRVSL